MDSDNVGSCLNKKGCARVRSSILGPGSVWFGLISWAVRFASSECSVRSDDGDDGFGDALIGDIVLGFAQNLNPPSLHHHNDFKGSIERSGCKNSRAILERVTFHKMSKLTLTGTDPKASIIRICSTVAGN